MRTKCQLSRTPGKAYRNHTDKATKKKRRRKAEEVGKESTTARKGAYNKQTTRECPRYKYRYIKDAHVRYLRGEPSRNGNAGLRGDSLSRGNAESEGEQSKISGAAYASKYTGGVHALGQSRFHISNWLSTLALLLRALDKTSEFAGIAGMNK